MRLNDMKRWRRRAKRWLMRNNVINGYGTPRSKAMIEDLAKTFEKIYNIPSAL